MFKTQLSDSSWSLHHCLKIYVCKGSELAKKWWLAIKCRSRTKFGQLLWQAQMTLSASSTYQMAGLNSVMLGYVCKNILGQMQIEIVIVSINGLGMDLLLSPLCIIIGLLPPSKVLTWMVLSCRPITSSVSCWTWKRYWLPRSISYSVPGLKMQGGYPMMVRPLIKTLI